MRPQPLGQSNPGLWPLQPVALAGLGGYGACLGHGIAKALLAESLTDGACHKKPVRIWTPSCPRLGSNRLEIELSQMVGNCADHNGND